MSAHLTEKDLFSALREYVSRLEVQYMIEEEVKKFQEKVLPRLLSEAFAAASHGATAGQMASSPGPSTTPAPSHVTATPNIEWVQTFLKAHADDALSRRLPSMISHEVQRQLRSASGSAQAESSAQASSSSSRSPPRGEAVVATAAAQPRVGLPPLPPSPPRPSLTLPPEITIVSAETSSAKHQGDGNRNFTSLASTAHDEGRRQREQVLSAISDIEHQLKDVQRDINEVVHQQRLSRCRLEYLCEVLQGTDLFPAAETRPSSLCVALKQALDDRQADAVRARLAVMLQGLLPLSTEPHPGRGTVVDYQPTFTLGGSPSPTPQDVQQSSPSAASVKSYAVPSFSSDAQRQSLTRSPSRLRCGLPSPPHSASGPVGAPPAHTPHSSGACPANKAPTWACTLVYTRHGDAAATTAGTFRPAGAAPAKAVRSITTRGTAASSLTPKAAPPPPPPVEQQPSALRPTHGTAPSPPPVLRQQSHDPLGAGGAVSRPTPLPQECAVPSMRDKTRRETHRGTSVRTVDSTAPEADEAAPLATYTHPSNARFRSNMGRDASSSSIISAAPSREGAAAGWASRAVVLGIDALNVPSGVLPGALGRQGAVRVQSIAPLQPAERAGVCRGDILLSVNHHSVSNCEELRAVLAAVPATQLTIAAELYRDTIDQIVSITLQL
ncbi:PDZ domain [Leishmania braziliensis]|nr:PDZ domain [Leishmania braziliensis]